MTCGEFLAQHSEYLDEELGAEAAAEMRLHLAGCTRCARYDRVLRRGLELVREVEPLLPTSDGYLALHQHLARNTPPPPDSTAPRAPFAVTSAVAGVVALLAWSALFRATGVPATASGETAPRAPSYGAAELLAGSGPELLELVAPPVLRGVDVLAPVLPGRGGATGPHASRMLVPTRTRTSIPGPYTPLLLRPPEFGQAADVSLPASPDSR